MNQPKIPNWVRHRFTLIPCLVAVFALLGGCPNPAGGNGSNPIGELRVTNATGSSYYPFLVWTGTEYGVVWYDNRDGNLEIYFSRLDPDGRKIGSDVRITSTDTPSALCTMAWTGTEFGIVWLEEEDPDEHWVHFARVNSIGEVVGSTLRVGPGVGNIAGNNGRPTIAWDGTNYGILWYDLPPPPDQMYTIFGRMVSPVGLPIMDPGELKAGSHQWPCCIWTGGVYAVAYMFHPGVDSFIGFDRYYPGAEDPLGPGTSISGSSTGVAVPSLCWNGSGYGITWEEGRDGIDEVYFVRLDANGARIGTEVRVDPDGSAKSEHPTIAWSGSRYGIVWHDSRFGSSEIFFRVYTAVGNPVGDSKRITTADGTSNRPHIVWNGSSFAVVWSDGRDGNAEIYFVRLDEEGEEL